MITQRNELGIEAFKRVIDLNSSEASAYINLATIYGRLEKNDEALTNYQKAFELSPENATHVTINNEYGFLLVRMGRIEEAKRTFEKMLQQDSLIKKEKGHRSLALLDIYFGKYRAAQEHLEEAVRLAIASKSELAELRDRLYLALVYLRRGGNAALEKEMNAVRQIIRESKIAPEFVYEVGRAYARSGRLKEAIQRLEEVKSGIGDLLALSGFSRSNRSDQANFYMLKGEVELLQKHYQEAIDSFLSAANLGKPWVEESLGYAFWKSGTLDKAAEKYEEFLKGYRIVGSESLERWILAHYELARVFEQKGQPEDAIKYYGRFLEIWKEGDPDLPVLIDAKKRLAKLKNVPQTPKKT